MLIGAMRARFDAEKKSFVKPCLPSPADKPPSGSNWIHEIKHDGFRFIPAGTPSFIRLITRRATTGRPHTLWWSRP
jgi:ATP-dependent DNA ligase